MVHDPVAREIFEARTSIELRDRKHYYSGALPIDELRSNYPDRSECIDIDFNEAQQIAFLKAASKYEPEFAGLPSDRTDEAAFYLRNGAFEGIDPFVLWVIVRESKPRNVIEVGSGFSSLLIDEALTKNREEDATYRGSHTIIDPYPRDFIQHHRTLNVIRERIQDIDPESFGELVAGDILFVDSSHIHNGPDSDVRFEINEIYPRLAYGVHVHVHDIYLPWHYPSEIILEERRPFNEQYMLQPYLSNPSVVIDFSSYFALRTFPDVVQAAFPQALTQTGASLWFRKLDPQIQEAPVLPFTHSDGA